MMGNLWERIKGAASICYCLVACLVLAAILGLTDDEINENDFDAI